jgi:AsmA protein
VTPPRGLRRVFVRNADCKVCNTFTDMGVKARIMPAESRKFRVLLYAVPALFLAALLAFFYLRNHLAAIAQGYVDRLAYGTHLSVQLPRVDVSFWPAPALVAGDFSLEGDGWHFSAKEIRLRPNLMGALRGAFIPDSLELTNPVLRAGNSAAMPSDIGMLFGPDSEDSGEGPDDIKLTVKNGEVIVVENDVDSPLVSVVDLTAGMIKARDGSRRCEIKMGGGFYRDGMYLPFFLGGDVFLRGGGRQAYSSFHQLAMEDVVIRLDNDAARLDAVLTLPGNAPNIPDDAPRPALSGAGFHIVVVPPPAQPGESDGTAEQRAPAPEDSFKLEGTVRVLRVSLSRWFGFGRILPPGLQRALDDVTDAVLNFSMDKKGLEVSSIAGHAAEARFTGSGNVKSWAEPKVALDLKTERLELLEALPEAAGRMPSPPFFAHSPLTPVPGAPLRPGETGLGYDIRLAAHFLGYGPLALEDAEVVIREGKPDENGPEDTLLTAAAGLYGGNVQGQAVFGGGARRPYAVSAYFRDVRGEDLSRSLGVLPVQSGHMRAKVNIKSQGSTLGEFFEKLTGRVEVGVGQGALRPLPSEKKTEKISSEQNRNQSGALNFDSLALELDITGASVFEAEKGRLGLNGHWSSVLSRAGYSLRADLTGMVRFGEGAFPSFNNSPGVLVLQSSSANGQGVLAELRGNFSRMSDNGLISISNGHLSSSVIEADGDARLFREGESFAYRGMISARCRDAVRAAELAGLGSKRLPGGLRRFFVKADVKGNMREITLDNLQAIIGDVPVRGSLSAAFHNQLSLEFNLAVGEFSFERFFKGNGAAPKNSAEPWDMRALRDARAKGILRFGRLKLWHFLLRDVNIPVTLDNGRLTAAPLTARLYGGSLGGKGILNFARGLNFESDFSVEGANLDAASRDISTAALLGGKMNITLNLSGHLTGASAASRSLNGSWRFVVRNGSYQKLGKNGAPGGKATLFDSAQASGDIKAGVAHGNDFVLRGKDLVMRGGGLADFNNDVLDCDFVINMKNLPDIPVHLHGSFKDSKTTVSVGKVLLNTLGGIPKGIFDILGDVVHGAWKLVR